MNERMKDIAELIETKNRVNVKELAQKYNVSEKTIRLDFEKLEKSGVLFRTRGGAVKRAFVLYDRLSEEQPIPKQHLTQKMEIARKAVSFIKENSTICLDAGSTTFEIARLLGDFPIGVITHDLNIVNELAGKENVELLIVGGLLHKNNTIISEELSARFVLKQTADVAFIAAASVSSNGGYTLFKRADKEIKRAYLQISDTSYGVIDSSKFEQKGLTKLAKVTEMPNLITDSSLNGSLRELYRRNGFHII